LACRAKLGWSLNNRSVIDDFEPRMKFRPCIDLHNGQVKQIVGSTLTDADTETPSENFATDRPAADYAKMYQRDRLTGGHVIKFRPRER
jgi:phosphoribosylformimino-5-aminoimidazole carboxamide ribotide isomerase